jgi:hypothetical protein
MRKRKSGTATFPIAIYMVSSTDHVTPVTNATPAVTLCKNLGDAVAAQGVVSNKGNGIYALAGDADDRDVLGECIIRATADGCDDYVTIVEIVPYDPHAVAEEGDEMVLSAAGNTAVAAQVDTTLTASHGAGAWGPGTGSGAFEVIVDLVDGDTLPIPDASVEIVNDSGVSLQGMKISDANGRTTGWRLNAGTYKVRARKSFVDFGGDFEFTISGNGTITVTGSVQTPSASSVGQQTVYGYATHGDGSAAASGIVEAIPANENQIVTGKMLSLKKIQRPINASGYFEIPLVQGGQYRVFESWGGQQFFRRTLTVTTDATKDLSTYTFDA